MVAIGVTDVMPGDATDPTDSWDPLSDSDATCMLTLERGSPGSRGSAAKRLPDWASRENLPTLYDSNVLIVLSLTRFTRV